MVFLGLEKSDKRRFFLSGIFFFLLGVLFLTNAEPYFPCNNDLSHYIGAAKSFLAADGYTFNGRSETLYPPGLSLSIAAIIYAFGDKYIYFSRYVAVCSILCLLFTFLYYKLRHLQNRIIYCIIIACSPVYFKYSTELGSDIPFMMSSMGFIFFAELINNRKRDLQRKYLLPLAGMFLLFAVASRSIGMALVAAIGATIIHSLYNHRKTSSFRDIDFSFIVFFVMGLSFYVLWSYWSHVNTTPLYDNEFRESYFRQFWLLDPHQPDMGNETPFFVFVRMLNNIPIQIAHLVEYLTNIDWIEPFWLSPLTIFSVVIIGTGLAIELRRPYPLAGWYTIFYAVIILGWPYNENKRFILADMPIIIILLVQGARQLVRFCQTDFASIKKYVLYLSVFSLTGSLIQLLMANTYSKQEIIFMILWCIVILTFLFPCRALYVFFLSPRTRSFALPCYMILFIIHSNFLVVTNINDRVSQQMDYPLENISLWLQNNTSPATTIISQSSAPIHYLTGRKTVPLPITGNRNILSSAINNFQPEYLVIDKTKYVQAYYRPTEEERFRILEVLFPGRFRKVYEYKDIAIYHVRL